MLVDLVPVQIASGGIFVRTTFETTGGPAQNAWGGHAQAMVRVVPGARPSMASNAPAGSA